MIATIHTDNCQYFVLKILVWRNIFLHISYQASVASSKTEMYLLSIKGVIIWVQLFSIQRVIGFLVALAEIDFLCLRTFNLKTKQACSVNQSLIKKIIKFPPLYQKFTKP